MDVDFERIKQLREEINKLIEERPDLAQLQEEIDNTLRGLTKRQRCVKIQEMLLNSWFRITEIKL